MEEEIPRKPYVVSDEFEESRQRIFEYSIDTFGEIQAERYLQKIRTSLDMLPEYYTYYPPCRHLPTRSHKYRNIIFGSHLIIYRIAPLRIEVLDIVHGAMSVSRIRSVRRIRID